MSNQLNITPPESFHEAPMSPPLTDEKKTAFASSEHCPLIEDDIKLVQMWNEGRSWEYIFAALPNRSEGSIRVSGKARGV